jgi:eukaryotic-like serine/threonine-protein kinase
VRKYWLPTIGAAVALERKDPNRAVELLQGASTIDFGEPTDVTVFLCPVYPRERRISCCATATERQRNFRSSWTIAALWQTFPWGALARLGLARAYAMQDSTAKAEAAYLDFLPSGKTPTPTSPSRSKPRQSTRS